MIGVAGFLIRIALIFFQFSSVSTFFLPVDGLDSNSWSQSADVFLDFLFDIFFSKWSEKSGKDKMDPGQRIKDAKEKVRLKKKFMAKDDPFRWPMTSFFAPWDFSLIHFFYRTSGSNPIQRSEVTKILSKTNSIIYSFLSILSMIDYNVFGAKLLLN